MFLVVCVCLCVGGSVGIPVYEHVKMNRFIVMIILYGMCVCECLFVSLFSFIISFHS